MSSTHSHFSILCEPAQAQRTGTNDHTEQNFLTESLLIEAVGWKCVCAHIHMHVCVQSIAPPSQEVFNTRNCFSRQVWRGYTLDVDSGRK